MSAEPNSFDWIVKKLPILIFLVIFIAQIVRGVLRSKSEKPPPLAKPDGLEEQRRVQEVQEQIRRRIAERRGVPAPPALPREHPPQPIERRPETTQMPEPFGGPLRRVFEEIEREINPQPPTPPPPLPAAASERRNAEIERQEQLDAQLKLIEEARVLGRRRAAQVAAEKRAEFQEEPALRSAARAKLLADLQEGESLRRAFVLREVLGPPVALR